MHCLTVMIDPKLGVCCINKRNCGNWKPCCFLSIRLYMLLFCFVLFDLFVFVVDVVVVA